MSKTEEAEPALALLMEVRWPAGRFHGVREETAGGRGPAVAGEWPPSPMRLFQALVAGAYGGRWAAEARGEKDAAFEWLEGLDAPLIAAPPALPLQPVRYFVPNNDLDTKDGDPARVGEIRASKLLHTRLFEADAPVAYLWRFPHAERGRAQALAALAERLHTLGHGMDAAFAHAEVMPLQQGEARLHALGGAPHVPGRPEPRRPASPCPARGSRQSLHRRHLAFTGRLAPGARKRATLFSQPPKPHLRLVAYDRPPTRRLYDLVPVDGEGRRLFHRWELERASALVRAVGDLASGLLEEAWPEAVERFVRGRGAQAGDTGRRLRILPLSSRGMSHTDPAVRRVLVEVPPDHPIPLPDLQWALAGRVLLDEAPGRKTAAVRLVPAADGAMLRRYGLGEGTSSRLWRTVTPAALPGPGAAGRDAVARVMGEAQAAGAVAAALRHAGVRAPVEAVRVQREPFDLKGARADAFDPDRFDRLALRHVEVRFAEPVAGPLALGNGRWVGLGVMAPVAERARERHGGVHAFALDRPAGAEDGPRLTAVLRRAVMARAGGRGATAEAGLDPFFTGHPPPDAKGERGSGPLRGGDHRHLFFAFDPGDGERAQRLLVVSPHRADRSAGVLEATRRRLPELAEALRGLDTLRAGAAGVFRLRPADAGALVGAARSWVSLTDYRPTRHPSRNGDAADALRLDILCELSRRSLPAPEAVEVLSLQRGPRGSLAARLRLRFRTAVDGPLMLGAGSHGGAGLFLPEP